MRSIADTVWLLLWVLTHLVCDEQMEADFLARQTNEDVRMQKQAQSARRKEDEAAARKWVVVVVVCLIDTWCAVCVAHIFANTVLCCVHRAERRRKQKLAIDRSRRQQLERKRQEKQASAARDLEITNAWKQVHKTIESEEAAEAAARKKAALDHQAFLLRQIAEKEAKIRRAQEQERAAANAAIRAARADDEAFRVTVKGFIAEEYSKGHNAKGVARSLHRVQEEQLQAATAFY